MERFVNNDLKRSLDRAIKLMGTLSNYDDYTIIKIEPIDLTCCCFHCLPLTWNVINEYIFPFGPLEDEGDVLIEKNNEEFVLECHESGPEIVFYGILSGIAVQGIIKVITIFLNGVQNDRKKIAKFKLQKRYYTKGQMMEEEIMEVDLPPTESTIRILNKELRNSIEKRKV